MAEDSIDFSAKYGNWVAIKRMSIVDGTKPEEVAFHLAAIRQSLDRKAFEILGLNLDSLDKYADSVTTGKNKAYSNLSEAVQSLGSKEAKAAAEAACGGKTELKDIANVYLLRKVVQNLKFDLDVNQEMLSKIYPNLKMPKQRGRKPKKD